MSMPSATLAHEIEDDELRFQHRFIRSLSKSQRRVLKAHGVGRLPVVVSSNDHATCKCLKAKHLIRFDPSMTPKWTEATEAGRSIIAAMLAIEAETLLEYLEP